MKNFFRPSLVSAALLLSAFRLGAASVTPYLETSSVTFACNFTVTGVAGTTIAIPVGGEGALDPDKLRPTDRVTTDIGTPINYSGGNGDQAFFVKHFIRAATERFAEQYKAIAIQRLQALQIIFGEITELQDAIAAIDSQLTVVTDTASRDALNAQKAALNDTLTIKIAEAQDIAAPFDVQLNELENRIDYLKKEGSDQWEITSVRNAQSSLAGATSTPFALFLTRTDRVKRGITHTFDTGLRLTPIYSAGNSVETFSSGNLTKVSGNYVTHLSLDFESLYATDPLSSLAPETRAVAKDGINYNTKAELWDVNASGYMTYTLRSTLGPIVAVYPTNIKLTGHGSWAHYLNIQDDNSGYYAGVAPFSIKMGTVNYQNKNIFPDFAGN